ncbi:MULTISPECIES: cytochrome P450 [Pseudofrankia]|uniref:cytochrome P450 n=1 Tax=Pseudofrankia TaxID=2994363 RepID=UPI000234CB19|nr:MULTISPECIES: cytochrome P450 [Pseudofrankia]OHV35282.1 hypothetical protein BCD49_04905 [Pseudofrankia sp. EUN1h]
MTTSAEILFDPSSPELRRDPYPVYRRMREQAPAWRSPDRVWYLSRYADCFTMFRSAALSYDVTASPSVQQTLSPDPGERAEQLEAIRRTRSLLDTDPPEHTRLRGLISYAFTAPSVERSRQAINDLVEQLMDDFDGPTVDVVAQYASLLPILVICDMLGAPPEDREQFIDIGNEIARSVDPGVPADQRLAAVHRMRGYIAGLLERRRRDPGDDLITRLIEAGEDGRLASEDELLTNTGVLLIAGFEATTNLITNAVYQLLRHPDQLALLRADPSLIRTTIEEVLRFDPPVHMMRARPITSEMRLGDVVLRPGEGVVPLIAAANRDPSEFEDAETFDVRRRVNRNLSFGLGHHFCVGAALARMEAQTAVRRLFERFPNIALTDEEPEFRPNLTLRGFSRLTVSL